MVLFGSTLLNREIPLKRSRIGGQKINFQKGGKNVSWMVGRAVIQERHMA